MCVSPEKEGLLKVSKSEVLHRIVATFDLLALSCHLSLVVSPLVSLENESTFLKPPVCLILPPNQKLPLARHGNKVVWC